MLKRMTINAILWHIESNIENTPLDINDLVKYSGYHRRLFTVNFQEIYGSSYWFIYSIAENYQSCNSFKSYAAIYSDHIRAVIL